ncbi:MAG: protein phosphatase 2C domain-containing protein [Clostridiales bacterium]|nr:protein phosphatase 2C domain-containing protein [Clostridiales bacterium]
MAMIQAYCWSNRGRCRPHNEDNLLFYGQLRDSDPAEASLRYARVVARQASVIGVFDGMGGMDCGEEASLTAAACLQAAERVPEQDAETFFAGAIAKANALVQENNRKKRIESGSTAALMLFCGKQVTVCNVGDSRVYRCSRDTLEQLSRDHTDRELIESLGIRDRAPRLLQYLGADDNLAVRPWLCTDRLHRNDRFLCCTDGLTSMIPDDELEKLLCAPASLRETGETLMQTALDRGGTDNITFILCRVLLPF